MERVPGPREDVGDPADSSYGEDTRVGYCRASWLDSGRFRGLLYGEERCGMIAV